MKKTIITLLLIFFSFSTTKAANLDVNANLESWEYEFAIEVFLNANDKNAKIFYYTDWEWRMDHIYEYKKWSPLIFKNYTVLNYYAIWENYTETKIKENIYEFNYPTSFKINYENNKIILKNEVSDVVNIWYFKIIWNNFEKEFSKNTFLEKWETTEVKYDWKTWEEIKLYTPDEKLILTYKIKPEIIKETKKEEIEKIIPEEINDENIETSEENIKEEVTETQEEISTENIETPEENNDKQIKEDTKNIENEEFNLNDEIKSSVSEKKDNSLYFLIYWFILITFLITLYNIFQVVKNYKSSKKEKNSLQNKKQK